MQMLGVLLLSMNVVANVETDCNDLIGCNKKTCHIKKDLQIAKKMKNSSRVKGLKIALEKVNKYCTDDKLAENLEEKIEESKKDLQEDIENYEESMKENRPEKIEKYKTKISEENEKIQKLEEELKDLQ
jgi:hypothetical protein